MPRALDRITVLDISVGEACALATMILSDNGARVIRVSDPTDERIRNSQTYRMLDRGKESLHLDLNQVLKESSMTGSVKDNAEKSSLLNFHKLIMESDILIDSYPPSSPFQELVDYANLQRINPSLVRCSVTAYGRHGPIKDNIAQDDLVMAQTGILTSQPSFRDGPIHMVHPIASIGAALLAVQGTVASLFARETTGIGRHLTTSLMAGVLANQPKAQSKTLKAWSLRQKRPTGDWPFYSVFRCSDGEWLQLGCIHDGFVNNAVEALGISESLGNLNIGTRYNAPAEEDRSKVYDIVANKFATRPMKEWAEIMEKADVPHSPILDIEETKKDPQAIYNKMFIQVKDPQIGNSTNVGIPIKLLKTPAHIGSTSPTPGKDSDAIYSEISSLELKVQENTLDPTVPTQPLPLRGVKVLAIDNVIAGPMSTRLLADLGAEVVKLEPPGGEISRPSGSIQFSAFNCNKKSVSVNGKLPEGQEIIKRLGSWADVISENMRSGAADRIGLSADDINQLNPDIVYTHITGFGSAGPYSHRPGLDPLAQAMAGLQKAQAGPDNPPVYLGALAPADYVGAMLGTVGSVLGLFVKARTGKGQRVETCLLNAGVLVAYMGMERIGDQGQYGRHALSRLYKTRDGWIYLVAESQEDWAQLCKLINRPDLSQQSEFATPDNRDKNDSVLIELLSEIFLERTAKQWISDMNEVGIPSALAVENYETGFFTDPQAVKNGMVSEQDTDSMGQVKFSANLIDFSNSERPIPTVTPMLGEHNSEVLTRLGYSGLEIEEFYKKKIINTDTDFNSQNKL